MDPLFDVRCVTYRYQRVTALDDLTLAIQPGQRVALLGANGSGKSTLLRMLDALIFPDSGSVSFAGSPLTEARFADEPSAFDFRRQVGLVFQNPDVQLFNPTVFDEVAFGPLQMRWPRAELLERVAAIMERMRITHLKDRSPHHLSGGEKKRVALASVMVLDPDTLLLDEPTAALDPKSQSQVIDTLIEWGGSGKTVIMATHDFGDLEEIADYCYIFLEGRLAAEGPPTEILRDAALLRTTGLAHAHRHRHATGELHSHPHQHSHPHGGA